MFSSFSIVQEAPEEHPVLRSHRVAVGLYGRGPEGIVRRRRVELDVVGRETEVPDLLGEEVPDLVLLNDDDLAFAKIRLDRGSLQTVVASLGAVRSSLARSLCWSACWDMTRDSEMPAREYLRLVTANVAGEGKVGVVQSVLAQAASAVYLYGDPANRRTAGAVLADACLRGLRDAEPGSDHQLAWARAFISSARSEEHLGIVRGLLEGGPSFQGLALDTDLRWHIVRSLSAAGAAGEDVIAAEQERDATDRGSRHAAAARAARPTPEAKAEAWETIVRDTSQPLALINEMMGGFQQFDQEDLLRPYAARFFEVLPEAWEAKDLPDALAFGRRMYPHLVVEERTADLTDRYLAGDGVPGPVRRLLLEGKDGILRALRTRAADR